MGWDDGQEWIWRSKCSQTDWPTSEAPAGTDHGDDLEVMFHGGTIARGNLFGVVNWSLITAYRKNGRVNTSDLQTRWRLVWESSPGINAHERPAPPLSDSELDRVVREIQTCGKISRARHEEEFRCVDILADMAKDSPPEEAAVLLRAALKVLRCDSGSDGNREDAPAAEAVGSQSGPEGIAQSLPGAHP